MNKVLRVVAVLLFVIATFAVASTRSTANAALGEGSAPTPLCQPGTDCRP